MNDEDAVDRRAATGLEARGSTTSGAMAVFAGITLMTLCGLAVQDASASPLWEWGGGPTSTPAYSGRLLASGGDAAYFNPARLADQQRGVAFGVTSLAARLHIEYDERPPGVDISDTIYDARVTDEEGNRRPPSTRPLPTDELPRQRGAADPSFAHPYATIATVLPVIEDRWVVGVYATTTVDRFAGQQPHYVDEREQYFSNSLHFERTGYRLVGAHFALATGIRVIDELYVGIGATMAQDATSDNEMFSPEPTDPSRSQTNTSVSIETRFVPHAGVEARPLDNTRLVATAHAPYANRVDGSAEIRFWNFPVGPDGEDVTEQQLTYLYDFEPWRIGVGAAQSWDVGPGEVEAGAQVVYGRWSDYVDRQSERPADAWRDIWTPTLSGVYVDDDRSIGTDLRFAPSPVPHQDGRSNYVDNSRWSMSASWTRAVDVFGVGLEAGLRAQFQWLVEQGADKSQDADAPVIDEFPESRHVDDDETIEESTDFRTNNPGYPGFRAGGFAVGGGLTISSEF